MTTTTTTTARNFWDDAEVISVYTCRQAIDDGLLVQLSGDGYTGDSWIPDACREAGFRFPIAITIAAFVDCVMPLEGDGVKLAPCQDAKGRLWDVLWMLKTAIRSCRGPADVIRFSLRRVPNIPANSKRHPRPELVHLKAVCGPDDDSSPCITIMLPEED